MDKKPFNFMRLALTVVLAAALVLTFSGCGRSEQENRLKTYGHDGYMGYSNSNPNLPNRYQYLNYNADGNFVEQVLRPLSGIEHTQIYFNGNDLHVNIKVNKSLSDEQAEKLLAEAQSVVQYNMPRYNVHVEAKK
ncbi:hypothetical protein BK133_18410 [Paenibacillus sp. FSL H8-0548]|uniref:hypothetical protein n=1 Tax=Paenibacillus sp. FSL H8-0548 TaxID=1920422 RepID=UPI00096C94AE|nr:hypothetical protein [Paenibacillus sp. FSL H8-0548]OMF29112.1 hypothetical protein BK133_18410 [Paenibacillus sp. FSL H8-0548]